MGTTIVRQGEPPLSTGREKSCGENDFGGCRGHRCRLHQRRPFRVVGKNSSQLNEICGFKRGFGRACELLQARPFSPSRFSRPVSKTLDALSLSVFFQRLICIEETPYSADNSDRVLSLQYALGRNLRIQFRTITITFVSHGSITSDLHSPSSAPFLYTDLY